MPDRPPRDRARLGELARVFLRLGTTAFGGPAAHIALLEDEVVRRRGWMTRQAFLDLLGATHLIPGPNSTEMAIHVGFARAGWPGLIVAGVGFIVPAALMVTGLAWVYVRYGDLPRVAGALAGITPVVLAVVAQAIWGLGRTALARPALWLVGLAALVATVLGVHELVVLAAAAALTVAARGRGTAAAAVIAAVPSSPPQAAALALATTSGAVVVPFALAPLFLAFLKIGSVLFGSGYVLLAFIRADFVHRLGWLTERQLLDATAVGLLTPGPVFTTATFIGYLVGGASGAVVATVGIFLPAFVFVAVSGPLIPRLRRSPVAGAALDGVNVASLALMAVVAAQLARTSLTDPVSVTVALVSVTALVHFRIKTAWLIGAGVLIALARAG